MPRWTSPDPVFSRIYDSQSLNRYTYVRNDPVNLVDPDGNLWKWISKAGEWIAKNTGYEDGVPEDYSDRLLPLEQSKPKAPSPLPPGCTKQKMQFFNTLLDTFNDMAKKLDVDVNFLMALSIREMGWLDPHEKETHNLFGDTKAGGNDLIFGSYQKSADFWVEEHGDVVKGKETIKDFVDALLKAKYNTVNPDWAVGILGGTWTQGKLKGQKTIGTYESVKRAREICNIDGGSTP